jgi:flagellar biosynthesis protein FliQ
MSLIQIITSIQDTGFNTIPRLAGFLAAFLLAMPWMLKQIMAYTILMLGDLGRYAR